MPAEAPTKPKRETWLDLLPDGALEPFLVTRDEVIGSLKDLGVDVNEVTLVFWEKSGVLPRPVRRWHAGAPHAMYPSYAIDAIEHLRQLQAAGRTLEQITPLMRMWALNEIQWQDPLSEPLTQARNALYEVARVRGIKASGIRIAFIDDNGEELWRHELAIPGEWG